MRLTNAFASFVTSFRAVGKRRPERSEIIFHFPSVIFHLSSIARVLLADVKREMRNGKCFAPIAQLDRASDFESEGRRFESCWVHQITEYEGPAMMPALRVLQTKMRPCLRADYCPEAN